MKPTSPLSWFVLCASLVATAGCANIEVVPESDPHRTVKGTVEFRADVTLPPDAVVVVRVLDTAGIDQKRSAANRDLPLGDRAKAEFVPEVLAEKTFTGLQGNSVPFQIEFLADDRLLEHGLNLDARISSGGKVRFRTANAHAVTLGNIEYPHTVWVELSGR